MSTFLNVLHIVGAVFIIGPMAILPMTGMRALRAGSASEVAVLAKSTYIFSLASLVVAFLGFGALGVSDPEDHFKFTTPWVLASFIIYAVAVLLSLLQVVPAMRRASTQLALSTSSVQASGTASGGAASGATGAGGTAADNGYAAIAAGSGIVSALLVVVVVLMVWKP
jgi:hypothetical protein